MDRLTVKAHNGSSPVSGNRAEFGRRDRGAQIRSIMNWVHRIASSGSPKTGLPQRAALAVDDRAAVVLVQLALRRLPTNAVVWASAGGRPRLVVPGRIAPWRRVRWRRGRTATPRSTSPG